MRKKRTHLYLLGVFFVASLYQFKRDPHSIFWILMTLASALLWIVLATPSERSDDKASLKKASPRLLDKVSTPFLRFVVFIIYGTGSILYIRMALSDPHPIPWIIGVWSGLSALGILLPGVVDLDESLAPVEEESPQKRLGALQHKVLSDSRLPESTRLLLDKLETPLQNIRVYYGYGRDTDQDNRLCAFFEKSYAVLGEDHADHAALLDRATSYLLREATSLDEERIHFSDQVRQQGQHSSEIRSRKKLGLTKFSNSVEQAIGLLDPSTLVGIREVRQSSAAAVRPEAQSSAPGVPHSVQAAPKVAKATAAAKPSPRPASSFPGKKPVFNGENKEEVFRYFAQSRTVLQASGRKLPAEASGSIASISEVTMSILRCMATDPRDFAPGERFLSTYLPAAHKLAAEYSKLLEHKLEPEKTKALRQRTLDVLDRMQKAFEDEHLALLQNDFIDLNAELGVLDAMLRSRGR